jgi:hypothetical protein
VAIARGPLDALERLRLEQAGAELLDYIPLHGYRLRVAPESEPAIRALPFIAWLGELPAWRKIEPPLAARAAAPAGAAPPAGDLKLRAILAAGEPAGRALAALAECAPAAAPAGKGGAWRITAIVPPARLAAILSQLAALPEVEAVESVKTMRLFNQDGVWVHQSFVGPSPQQAPIFAQGIVGCGQIVAVADTGQDYDLCYFRDTVNGAPPRYTCSAAPCPVAAPALNRRKDIIYYNWSPTPTGDDDTCPATTGASGHGTHTSGSIAGDNATYASCTAFTAGRTGGDGQAPGAKLVIQEMGDGLEYLNNLNGTVWNLADVAYQNGARIHSNSWGGACYNALGECIPGCTAPYDSYARDADLAMWNYPDLLMLFAAGNAGQYCPAPVSIGTPAVSKSPLAVGSVGHGVNADLPSGFSSPGPVFDGRLRPTLAAQGESVVSAASDGNPASNNCATCSLDGTSMATPTTAGLAALVREYYTAGYYAAGARNAAQGITPTGALLKATLMNGAVPLGLPAPDPDFDSGYGRVLLGDTLAFTASPFKLRADDHREGITSGSVVPHAYDVAAGQDFIVSLAWSDYPAALNAAVARVNELKLEVTDPAGTVWFQTLGAGGSPVQTSLPGDAHDSLNVEERLVFENAAAGRWIVKVKGIDVPWGPQPFALLTRGALAGCPAPAAPGTLTLTTPADHQVNVSWGVVGGALKYNVYRSYGGCPSGGPWVPVTTGVSATNFLDTTVSGGLAYSYYVAATSDAAAACESPRSPCGDATPAGDCDLSPFFRGVSGAQSAGQSACGITLDWSAAAPYCGSDVKYNVYRSPTAPFTPGPANRIARCVSAAPFTDSASLANGATYHYIVRSEDATAGHGGPCRGGNEDGNLADRAAAPDGLPVIGSWSDNAGDTGPAKFGAVSPWIIDAAGGAAGPKVYHASSSAEVCADLTTPVLTLADPGESPSVSFATKHSLEYDPNGPLGSEGSLGVVEVATGPDFTGWSPVLLTPDYPALIDFHYSLSCQAGPGQYFSGLQSTYLTYSGSLINWGGGDVKLRFHLAGDDLYPGGDWWVDDVVIDKAMVPGACAPQAPGPPPVPDGATLPGIPLKAVKSGGNVTVTWDAARCPASAVNLYRGAIGNYSAFTAGNCGLAPSGSTTQAIPNGSWFIIAAQSGAADGSYGLTPAGAELGYTGAATACPAITQHVTTNQCP